MDRREDLNGGTKGGMHTELRAVRDGEDRPLSVAEELGPLDKFHALQTRYRWAALEHGHC